MTVQELIDILESIPNKSQEVYLSSDAEGNRYSPVRDIEHSCICIAGGDLYLTEDNIENSVIACVLWP